jgi:hypothetical protein
MSGSYVRWLTVGMISIFSPAQIANLASGVYEEAPPTLKSESYSKDSYETLRERI